MPVCRHAILVLSCVCLLATQTFAADTIEDIEKKICAAAEKVNSLTCKTDLKAMVKFDGGSSKTDSTGDYETMRKGDKTMFRSDSKINTVTTFGNTDTKSDTTILMTSDGNFVYTVSETGGQKTVLKTKQAGSLSMVDAKGSFANLHKTHDLKVLPDEKVNGADTWVIEGTPKKTGPADNQLGRSVYYYSKASGVALKIVTFDKDNKPQSTMLNKDIKINPKIDEKRFEFKAPEGATIMDMTKPMELPGAEKPATKDKTPG